MLLVSVLKYIRNKSLSAQVLWYKYKLDKNLKYNEHSYTYKSMVKKLVDNYFLGLVNYQLKY